MQAKYTAASSDAVMVNKIKVTLIETQGNSEEPSHETHENENAPDLHSLLS